MGEERSLGVVAGEFTVKGLQVVKTNLGIYRMQMAAEILLTADGIFTAVYSKLTSITYTT